MNVTDLTDALTSGTVDELKNNRQNRFTHLLVLREVTSAARFTTDGETANTTMVRTGDPEEKTVPMNAVDMFYRKQPGAERRRAKEIQRDLLSHVEACASDQMDPNEMSQSSVESVLFGSAAGDAGVSQRSRVYYNSAYSIRSAEMSLSQNKQNSPGSKDRNRSAENQGLWTHDFVQPNTLFPSVVTLDSATPEEVLFTMAVIDQTTRYGATTTRGGCVNNHLLGAYCGTADAPSNLQLVQKIAGELAEAQTDGEGYTVDDLESVISGPPLALREVREATLNSFEELCDRRNMNFTNIPRDDVNEALEQLNDDGVLAGILETQNEKVENYLESFEN